MNRSWWGLPGPRSFIEKIEADIQRGRSTVIRVPSHYVPELGSVLRREIRADWREIRDSNDSRTTIPDLLLTRFAPDTDPGERRNAKAVIMSEALQGRAFLIELDASAECLRRWNEFLDDFGTLARALEPFQRPAFCLVVRGGPNLPLPHEGVCLAHHRWRGVVSGLDMALYVAQILRPGNERWLETQTRSATIVRVAMWDREMAEKLCDEPLNQLFSPENLTQGIAEERNWKKDGQEREDSWLAGKRDLFDGVERDHSAALFAKEQREELASRVWGGQVGVLFPFLEECRRNLLERWAHLLTVPYQRPNAPPVTDRRDLELSHILRQLQDAGPRLPRSEVRALHALVGIRNSLAHFEVVSASRILDPDLPVLKVGRG